MSFGDQDHSRSLVEYHGLPKTRFSQDSTAWARFLKFICPWLRRKRELGDEYLEAQVLKERASAILTMSEALKNIAEAKKTAAETAAIADRQDAEKAQSVKMIPGVDTLSSEELEKNLKADLEALEEKIRSTRLLYGTRILHLEGKPAVEENS